MPKTDDAEFTEFATAVAPRLRRTAYLMCGDWHRAEDAAQEALIRLYGAWHRLVRHPTSLSVYSHKTLVSVVLDQSRRPWRREHSTDPAPAPVAGPDATETVDTRQLVIAALSRLPPRQRACVVLRHYVDLSLEETAQVLGIGVGAVKSQTSRGLARLREELGPPDGQDRDARTRQTERVLL